MPAALAAGRDQMFVPIADAQRELGGLSRGSVFVLGALGDLQIRREYGRYLVSRESLERYLAAR